MLQLQLLLNVVSFVFLPGPGPLSLLYTPFSFSVSALPCQATYNMAINIFAAAMGKKKNKVERRRKTSLPHPEMLLLSCLLCLPPSLYPPPPVYAPPLPLNCNLLPFGWLLLPRHWGSSCSTSATAARINGRQLKQITFIVITPHVSPTPPLACPHLPCVLSVWLIRKLCCILCALCSFYRVWVGVWLPTAAAIWFHI